MSWSSIFAFLEFCVTSFPLPLALLVLILGFGAYYFFKVRPAQQEREDARDEANRKREAEYLQAMASCKESYQSTVIMYEKALENSTRAIENSTAAIKMMTKEMEHLRDFSKKHDESLEKVKDEINKTNEQVIKTVAILESRN